MPVWQEETTVPMEPLPLAATPGYDLNLEAEGFEGNSGAEEDDRIDPLARVASWCMWVVITVCFAVYLFLAHVLSTGSGNTSAALWSALLVLPIVLFLLGPWLLGCRKQLSQWRVLIAIILSVIAGVASMAVQYGAFFVLLIMYSVLDENEVPSSLIGMSCALVMAVIFSISGEFAKVAITAGAAVDYHRSKTPMGYVVLAAISSMAYVTFESLEYAILVSWVPGWWNGLAFVAFRIAFGIAVDCFTGIMYGARMSKYSVQKDRSPQSPYVSSSFKNFCKSFWAPLLIHLVYDLGLFFTVFMFIIDNDRQWFYCLFMPATVTVVAGVFALSYWLSLRSLVQSDPETTTTYAMTAMPSQSVV